MSALRDAADKLVELDGQDGLHTDVQARINSYRRMSEREGVRDAAIDAHARSLVRAARTLGVSAGSGDDSVAGIKARVGDDPDAAREALDAENGRETPRSTLVKHLEKIVSG